RRPSWPYARSTPATLPDCRVKQLPGCSTDRCGRVRSPAPALLAHSLGKPPALSGVTEISRDRTSSREPARQPGPAQAWEQEAEPAVPARSLPHARPRTSPAQTHPRPEAERALRAPPGPPAAALEPR